jgi:hypothetical protein
MHFSEMSVNWTWYLTSTRWDISFQLHTDTQVYAILDEVFLAGEIEETSKEKVLMRLEHLDKLE